MKKRRKTSERSDRDAAPNLIYYHRANRSKPNASLDRVNFTTIPI